jgi:hypothetical protein
MGTLEDECETALEFLQHGLDEGSERAPERRLRVPEILGKNGDGFRIRLRFENVAPLLKDLTEITRVGDDSVMDDAEFGPMHNTL